MAPFTPFLSEEIYRNLTGEESVHLADWPKTKEELIDEKLNEDMGLVRFIVTMGLQTRAEHKIKVRQPLMSVIARPLGAEMEEIVKDELNVKSYESDGYEWKEGESFHMLDLTITPELKLEGQAREIIRAVQEGRKKAKFNVEDRIVLGYVGKDDVFAKFENEIAKEVLATKTENGTISDAEYTETVSIEGEIFTFSLKRI